MVSVDLPYVKAERDRHGRIMYWYFRRQGRRWRLPGEPLSAEFMREYHRLLAETTPTEAAYSRPVDRREFPRGTFGRLVADFMDSAQFKTKKRRTKGEYRRVCEGLQQDHGRKLVSHLERRHVRQMRDEKAEIPGAANTLLRMIKILLNFAVEDGLIAASPAAKLKELPVGEWRAWSDKECAAFEKRWPPGSMQRRAYSLALYTGQRLTDLVSMTRSDRQDGCIRVVQSKTGAELWVPEHSNLTAELSRGVTGITTLLTTPTQGKSFDPVYFGAWFAEAIDKAGLPDDCVTHGLRAVASRKLSELGCSEDEIRSITGHTTSRMVAHYTKSASQRRRATSAIRKWENAK